MRHYVSALLNKSGLKLDCYPVGYHLNENFTQNYHFKPDRFLKNIADILYRNISSKKLIILNS